MDNTNKPMPATGDTAPQKRGMFRRLLGWYWVQHDGASKGEPVKRTMAAVLLLALGVAGSEAYGYVRDKFREPDAYLVTMKQDQDAAFKKLQDSLSSLGSAVEDSGRDALADVRDAVGEMRSANQGLLAQLALAKQENTRLSLVAGQQAGVTGGYDVILSEHTGLALDATSVLGVQSIQSNGAWTRVSAKDLNEPEKFLESGEAIAYKDASGRSCRVVLLSVSASQSASFKTSCG
ncbi:MAG: hypothetical protein ABIO75_05505 [Thermomonas sp.]